MSGNVCEAPAGRVPQGKAFGGAWKGALQGQDPVFLESPERSVIEASPSSPGGPPAGPGAGNPSSVSGHQEPGGIHTATEVKLLPGSRL